MAMFCRVDGCIRLRVLGFRRLGVGFKDSGLGLMRSS